MSKLRWWDGEGAERLAIGNIQESLDYMVEGELGMAEQIGKLLSLDRKQGQQILELKTMLFAVSNLLVESGVVTDKQLSECLSGALDGLNANAAAPGQGAKTGPMTRCTSCRKEVPAKRTNFTESGEVCDACFSDF